MEKIYEAPVKYYALLYDSRNYKRLQKALRKAREGKWNRTKFIRLLLKYAEAAVFIGELTANQVTVVNTKGRKEILNRGVYWWLHFKLIEQTLIPDNALLLLRELRNETGCWDKYRDIVCGIAERVKNLPCDNLTREVVPDEILSAIEDRFDSRYRTENEPPTTEEKTETFSALTPTTAELNEISLMQHKGKGWYELERIRLKAIGKAITEYEVKKGSRRLQRQILAYRKQQEETS